MLRRCYVLLAVVMAWSGGGALCQTLTPKDMLGELYEQLGGGRLPACPNENAIRDGADDAKWLQDRFNQTGWDKLERDYAASLKTLHDAFTAALKSTKVPTACAMLMQVSRDLHVKRQDCRQFGHSRTNIAVEVRTPEEKWEVYTRWLPDGDRFSGAARRLKDLSTPARGTVPVPGEYEIFAKKGSQSTAPVRVSIGAKDPFVWDLAVPAPGAPAK